MKYLHTMLRVGNLERSLNFYCNILNFEVRKKVDHELGKFTLAFLHSKDGGADEPEIELTYNWGVEKYDLGAGYGHLAFAVKSIEDVQKALVAAGLDLSWGPSVSPSGSSRIAFFKDPDGYSIELIEKNSK